MKKLVLFLFLSTAALASTSTLTNTVITDPDSQTWNNCTWSAVLNSPNGPPTISGLPVSPTSAAGSCSSVGKITATLTDTGSLDQTGATWVFTLTPNASSVFAPAVISTTAVTGATPNLSTVLSAVPAPRFPPGANSFGYLSGEVQNPIVGSVFFDVTGDCQRQYSLAGWSTCSTSGGSGTVTSVSVTTANGVSGTVATATTTPAISLTLGAIVPTSVNGITLTTGGSAATFLNGAGAYTTPSGSSIANIIVTLPTSTLTANTCSTPATATMTGLATTSVFDTAFATNPNAVNGWGSAGGLVFTAWPTANTLNWSVCNTTTGSITPGAMSLNVGAK